MNESKCKVCDTDLVWVGSMMDGGAECPTCSSATKGLTMAASSCLDNYVSVPGVYTRVGNMVTAHVKIDAQKVVEHAKRHPNPLGQKVVDEVSSFLPEYWEELKARVGSGTPLLQEEWRQQYECEYFPTHAHDLPNKNNDIREAHEYARRGTGKTSEMIRQAVERTGECVILCATKMQAEHTMRLANDFYGCRADTDRHALKSPYGHKIYFVWNLDFMRGCHLPVYVDHNVSGRTVSRLREINPRCMINL